MVFKLFMVYFHICPNFAHCGGGGARVLLLWNAVSIVKHSLVQDLSNICRLTFLPQSFYNKKFLRKNVARKVETMFLFTNHTKLCDRHLICEVITKILGVSISYIFKARSLTYWTLKCAVDFENIQSFNFFQLTLVIRSFFCDFSVNIYLKQMK